VVDIYSAVSCTLERDDCDVPCLSRNILLVLVIDLQDTYLNAEGF
jgi:hypothetical protein